MWREMAAESRQPLGAASTRNVPEYRHFLADPAAKAKGAVVAHRALFKVRDWEVWT